MFFPSATCRGCASPILPVCSGVGAYIRAISPTWSHISFTASLVAILLRYVSERQLPMHIACVGFLRASPSHNGGIYQGYMPPHYLLAACLMGSNGAL